MKYVILAGAMLSLLVPVNLAAQQAPEAVFAALDGAVADSAARSLTVAKRVSTRRLTGMRLDRLFNMSAERVLLNLDDRELVARFDHLDADIAGHRVWVGTIDGIEYSHVSFAEREGVVSGLVDAVAQKFSVRTVVPGVYAIEQIVDSGGELDPVIPQASDLAASAAASEAAAQDNGSLIDVLLLYTPGARVAVGGAPQINAMVAQIISDTNSIYGRSGIATRVRLVGAVEAPLPETTDMLSDLEALSTSAAVNAARNAAGADLVQLIMNSASTTSCGIGYLLTQSSTPASFPAYSIADYSCVGQYTPTHEMGHNMGSHHAPEDGAGGALFAYSYGYKLPGVFRTVMAYACSGVSCPRIMNFSNPGVAHNGASTGTGSQNNALSINNAAFTVANFRQATGPVVTPPSAPTGLQSFVNGSNVTLVWNPVTTDVGLGAAAATGYVLQVGQAPGVYNLLTIPVGNTTTVSGAVPASTYFWRVFGTNSAGNGVPSAEASFTVGGCAPPGAPQGFTHSVGAGGLVTLSWAAPVTGSGPFAYTIDVGNGPGLTNVGSVPVGGTTSLSVPAPSGTYFVRIRAANACAAGPPSIERTIVVP